MMTVHGHGNRYRGINLANDFDFGGCCPYTQMLTSNSWDVLWMANVFLNGMLCLFPGRSLVSGMGRGEGAPCQTGAAGPVPLQKIAPQENPAHRSALGECLRENRQRAGL